MCLGSRATTGEFIGTSLLGRRNVGWIGAGFCMFLSQRHNAGSFASRGLPIQSFPFVDLCDELSLYSADGYVLALGLGEGIVVSERRSLAPRLVGAAKKETCLDVGELGERCGVGAIVVKNGWLRPSLQGGSRKQLRSGGGGEGVEYCTIHEAEEMLLWKRMYRYLFHYRLRGAT